jgi:hypothetical protein
MSKMNAQTGLKCNLRNVGVSARRLKASKDSAKLGVGGELGLVGLNELLDLLLGAGRWVHGVVGMGCGV